MTLQSTMTLLLIAEIELYSFVTESDTASTVTQSSTSSKTEEELDEIDLFLK